MYNRTARVLARKAFYSTGVSKRLPLERITTPHEFEEIQKAGKSAKVWGAMWLFGVVPLMIGVGYVAIKQQLEEIEHAKKHYEEHGPPKFLPAPYMRKRTSEFPWGDNTWFENPYFNSKPPTDE